MRQRLSVIVLNDRLKLSGLASEIQRLSMPIGYVAAGVPLEEYDSREIQGPSEGLPSHTILESSDVTRHGWKIRHAQELCGQRRRQHIICVEGQNPLRSNLRESEIPLRRVVVE